MCFLRSICLFAALAAELIQGIHVAGVARRTELVDRELNLLEQLTGIVVADVAAALLVGDAAVVNRNQQMCVTLQTNDGELTQSHKKYMAGIGNHSERFVEDVENLLGDRCDGAGQSARIRWCADIRIQQNGLYGFHHSFWVGRGNGNIGAGLVAAAGRGYKQLGAAVAAKQNGTLGKNGKSGDGSGAGAVGIGFAVDLVVVGQIHCIKSTVH